LDAQLAKSEIRMEFTELKKLGGVNSSEWQAYTWKNELAVQKQRIAICLNEVITEAETEHNPLHMLERAIGIAAVCMRRLIECRLVTDQFRDSQLEVHEVSVKAGITWREPFVSKTSGEIFHNYDLTSRRSKFLKPKVISDKMLHARVLAVLSENNYLSNGLLIASDTQRKTHLFHFEPSEITAIFDLFLNDQIMSTTDGYLDSDGVFKGIGSVFATRS
jgi:hypothetical protein